MMEGLRKYVNGPAFVPPQEGAFQRALQAELDKAEMDLIHDLTRQVFSTDAAKVDRVWVHYSPVLVPSAWRVECFIRHHWTRWLMFRSRLREAWDVLRHGLPESADWY